MPAVLDGLVDDPPLVIVKEARAGRPVRGDGPPGTRAADVRTAPRTPTGSPRPATWIAAHLPTADVLITPRPPRRPPRWPAATSTPPWPRRWPAEQHRLDHPGGRRRGQPRGGHRFVSAHVPPARHPLRLAASHHARRDHREPPGCAARACSPSSRFAASTSPASSPRPIKDRHAEYWFHLDCTGHVAEPRSARPSRRCTAAVTGCGSSVPIRAALGDARVGGDGVGSAGVPARRSGRGRPSPPPSAGLPALRSGHVRVTEHDELRPPPAAAGCGSPWPGTGSPTPNLARALDSRPPGAPLDELGRHQADELAAAASRCGRSAPCTPRAPCAPSRPPRRSPRRSAWPSRSSTACTSLDAGDLEGRADAAARAAFEEIYHSLAARGAGRPAARRRVRPRPAGALPARAGADRPPHRRPRRPGQLRRRGPAGGGRPPGRHRRDAGTSPTRAWWCWSGRPARGLAGSSHWDPAAPCGRRDGWRPPVGRPAAKRGDMTVGSRAVDSAPAEARAASPRRCRSGAPSRAPR